MIRFIAVAAAAAALLDLGALGPGAAQAAMRATPLPGAAAPAPAGQAILAAAKGLGVIPANCTMDPFKKVYVCCTLDSSGNPVCTEHPLDTDWPVQQRFQQLRQVTPAAKPLLLQPQTQPSQ